MTERVLPHYKIWDWDTPETPFTSEQIRQRMSDETPEYYADLTIEEVEESYANELGRPKFIGNLVNQQQQTDRREEDERTDRKIKSSLDSEEIKFWRRKDILVPGEKMEINSKVLEVHLLKEKPQEHVKQDEEENDEEYYCGDDEEKEQVSTETIVNEDRCIYIGSVLSTDECSDLKETTSKLGYEEIDKEYPKEYRNSQRVITTSKKFAELLWDRIRPYLKKSDLSRVKPYGFDNGGTWIPIGINECMRFNKYSNGTFFKPHTDAQFIRSDNEKSIFTVLVYLSSSDQGTTLLKKVGEEIQQDDLVFKFKQLARIQPNIGSVAIFNHDLYHAGERVNYGFKYVMRTELVFKRVDQESIYRMDYRNSEEFQKVKRLIDDSHELEKKGSLTESTIKYVQAMDMQRSMSHSLKRTSNRKLSVIEQTLPQEVFTHIFNYLTDEEVCRSIIPLNTDINVYARDEYMWKAKYNRKWGKEAEGSLVLDRTIDYGYRERSTNESTDFFSSKENEIITNLQENTHDWYNAFVSRSNMEKFFNSVLLDLGQHTIKYGLAKNTSFFSSPSIIGIPNHPRFYLPSHGFGDIITGDRLSDNYYHCSTLKFITEEGIENMEHFKIFLYQIYREDLRVNLKEHPLLLVVPPHWESCELQKIQEAVFSLGIPALHIEDSFKMLSLYHQKPTSFIISITPSGVTALPVVDCEPKKDHLTHSLFNLYEKCKGSNDNIMYYHLLYIELSSFIEVAPCSQDEDRNAFNKHKMELLTSYTRIPSLNRFKFSEWFYRLVLETVQKGITRVIDSQSLSKDQIQTILNDILIMGGLSFAKGLQERLKRDIARFISPQFSLPVFTVREEQAQFVVRTTGVKIGKVGQEMDVVGGARIIANLSNFRETCKYNTTGSGF